MTTQALYLKRQQFVIDLSSCRNIEVHNQLRSAKFNERESQIPPAKSAKPWRKLLSADQTGHWFFVIKRQFRPYLSHLPDS